MDLSLSSRERALLDRARRFLREVDPFDPHLRGGIADLVGRITLELATGTHHPRRLLLAELIRTSEDPTLVPIE